MSFDAWVVGFGLSRVLIELRLAESPWAYSVLAAAIAVDGCLLVLFFTGLRPLAERAAIRLPLQPTNGP
jgi:hypothetical protein